MINEADNKQLSDSFKTLFMQAPTLLCILKGRDFRYEFVNPAHNDFFGSDFTGRTIADVFPESGITLVLHVLEEVITSSECRTIKEMALFHADEKHYFDAVFSPLKDEAGSIQGVIGYFTPVTSLVQTRDPLQKNIQELEAERKMREKFVYALTHDLRSSMAAVKMSAEFLVRDVEDLQEVKEYAQIIIRNSDRAIMLVEDLLDANQLRAGQKPNLKKERCNLRSIVDEALDGLTAFYGSRFVVNADQDIEGFWDRKAMRRIIENLCSNAVKYGEPKKPITLSFERESDSLKLSVHNEGGLIAPGEQARIFELFERSQTAQDSGKSGWGIGMTIIKGLTEAHGGRISLQSSPEAGTVFTLRIPVGRPESSQSVS